MWTSILMFSVLYCTVDAVTYYNTYRGEPATDDEIAEFQEKSIADVCTVSVDDCNESELRRADASCNNLKYPSHGMYHTHQWRMLPADYGENYEPRLTSIGEEFPYARVIRELLVHVGTATSEELTNAGAYFIESVSGDIVSIHDIRNFVFETTDCCEPSGLTNYMCTPNYIPSTDSVFRFTNLRCQNNTRPISYQTTGCTANNSVPARVNYATTPFDLSNVYLFRNVPLNESRAFEGGRLKVEVVNGGSYPSTANANTTCTIEAASQTGCTRRVPNGLLGFNLFTTWWWRHHNWIADGLAELNPCWDDEMLFRVAMDINIAYYTHVLYYEYLPLVLGRENMIKDGIILPKPGHRDVYDEKIPPRMALEFLYAFRWFHGTQAAQQQMYDENDNYVKTRSMVNFSLLVQDLPYNENMVGFTHGILLQPSGAFDDTADPDITGIGLGQYQDAFDILTADLAKGRYYGLPPYIKYRDMCTDYTIKHESYEDLEYLIKKNKMDLLKLLYKNVLDFELMAGIWSEDFMEGSYVPHTIYCLLSKQLKRNVITDRFWFENPNRPNPLTADQMAQITSGSFAGLLCSVGDKVSYIQPEAFRRIGYNGNHKVSCSEIPQLDLTPWKDSQCDKSCEKK